MQDQSAADIDMQDGGMRLRVIAGLQRGAEMALRPGRYLVGADAECDIVLADDLIADTHLVIDIADGGLTVEAHGGPAAVGDKLLQPGEGTREAPPLAISLGQTGLGVGDPETDWSALAPPDLAAVTAAAEETDPEEDQEGVEGAADEDDAETETEAEADELFADAQTEEATAQDIEDTTDENADGERTGRTDMDAGEAAADHKALSDVSLLARLKEHQSAGAIAAALGVAVIATTAFLVHGTGDHSNREAVAQTETAAHPSSHDSIRMLLNEAGIAEVDLRRDENGFYRLSGYIADKEARTAMHSVLQEAQVSFHDKVRQVDEIMRTVQFSLDRYQWPTAGFSEHLILSYIGGGVFALDGYLGPEVDRTDLNRQIMADAPGVVRLDFKRARLADWRAELENELERAGLKPWIVTNLVDGAIHVSGEVTPKEADAWRNVGQEFVAKSRGWPKLKIAVRAAGRHRLNASARTTPEITTAAVSAPRAKLSRDVNIIGVIMPSNGPGRVLLDNGSSRAEGEALYDGAILQSVSLNKIIIRKGGKGMELRIGEQG